MGEVQSWYTLGRRDEKNKQAGDSPRHCVELVLRRRTCAACPATDGQRKAGGVGCRGWFRGRGPAWRPADQHRDTLVKAERVLLPRAQEAAPHPAGLTPPSAGAGRKAEAQWAALGPSSRGPLRGVGAWIWDVSGATPAWDCS